MKRILIIGSGGSGKSTLARQLSAATGLPLIHLDAIYWRPGWEETPKPEWVSMINHLVKKPEWIMDGNYGGTLDQRLDACDTVILLDISPWLCLWRVGRRRLRHAGQSRPELAPDCPERLDAKFLWWVATYQAKRLPRNLIKLRAAERSGKKVVILRSLSEVQRFLSEAPPDNSFKPMPLRGAA
jgi:adenylate kinase family enzyme